MEATGRKPASMKRVMRDNCSLEKQFLIGRQTHFVHISLQCVTEATLHTGQLAGLPRKEALGVSACAVRG